MRSELYVLDCAETVASPAEGPPTDAPGPDEAGARLADLRWAWVPASLDPSEVQGLYARATGEAPDPYDPDGVLAAFLALVPGATSV